MSRELKRVPLDFNWPINKKWEGYMNPFYKECEHCVGGYTPARIRLDTLVRLLMISGDDAKTKTNHPYFTTTKISYLDIPPSEDMLELTKGLAGTLPEGFFGYTSTETYKATVKIIESAGLNPDEWGICKICNGEDIDPDFKVEYESWKATEPPEGTGYQLWENVTEGSPISPVFNSLDDLCTWCADNTTTFADFKATAEEWKKMLGGGLVHHKEGNAIFL